MSTEEPRERITVVGTGTVGATLARRLAAAGHPIVVGARDAGGVAVTALLAELGPPSRAIAIDEAIAATGLTLVAIPGWAMDAFVDDHAAALAGKVVIDATNDVSQGHAEGTLSGLPHLADRVPTSQGYRAFNSVGFENMADPHFGALTASMFYAGPDTGARADVEQVIRSVGFDPVYVGAGADAHHAVDALATLWFALAFGQGRGRRLAFRLLDDA